jgi:ATP-dependent helicase/DNAse subunit B
VKLESLSASRIKTFEQCELKYHAIYELHLPEEEVHPLTLMGSAVHRMLERATLAVKSEGPSDPFTYKAEACREFSVPVEHWDTIDELVGNALTWGYFRTVSNCVGCELKCRFYLPDGTPVNGIIDRLNLFKDWADIIDIKTQKDAFEPQELYDNWQARIYNIAVRVDHPEVTGKVSVSFWVLRHQVQRVWLTGEDAENDILRLFEKAASIRACISPKASPSGLCPWCPNCEHCSLSKSGIKSRMANKKAMVIYGR